MKKTIALGLATAGLALATFGAGAADAAKCTNGPSNGTTQATAPGTGSQIYSSPLNGSTSGFVGVKGGTGFIEGNGSANGGYIHGEATPAGVNGKISGGPSGASVCVNDTRLP